MNRRSFLVTAFMTVKVRSSLTFHNGQSFRDGQLCLPVSLLFRKSKRTQFGGLLIRSVSVKPLALSPIDSFYLPQQDTLPLQSNIINNLSWVFTNISVDSGRKMGCVFIVIVPSGSRDDTQETKGTSKRNTESEKVSRAVDSVTCLRRIFGNYPLIHSGSEFR